MLTADMQKSADQATTAASIVVTAARPVAVVNKKLEHEVKQLHSFCGISVRHRSHCSDLSEETLAYHRVP
jgi:hypothetical protein